MNRKTFLATLGVGAMSLDALAAVSATKSALPPPNPRLQDLLCVDDVEALARTLMPSSVTAFVSGGAADELTVRWNREKYRELRLQPRVLIDTSHVDCATTLFGQKMSSPILLAPTSSHRFVHPEGELATARGAGLAGATLVLSSGANTSIEDVMQVATQPVWFQLYVAKDRGLARAVVERVQEAGAKALVVTVDNPVDGSRNRQFRDPMVTPPGVTFPHYVGITEPASTVTLDEVRPARLERSEEHTS